MPVPSPANGDYRVLVLAPTGKDSALICQVLGDYGHYCEACKDAQQAADQIRENAGVAVVAEEALSPRQVQILAKVISQQPSWSDFPLIVLTSGGHETKESRHQLSVRAPLGNVTLLERPVRPATLASAVESAIRGRRRQYDMRDRLAEREQAQEALRKSEKLAVAGKLAASIAHEINNPLAAVTNLAYLIATSSSLEEAKRYATLAENELARVTEITTQTLRFYRQQTRPVRTQVAEIVDSVLALFQARLNAAEITVERQYDQTDPLLCYSGELRQLVANLVGNAIDAMRAGGRLLLRVAPAYSLNGVARRGVRITVADTGIGIPVELRNKLFEPFVTTKTLTGTGLGLWVSEQITRNHGGTIRFRSRATPGRSGTVFSIFLPYEHAPSKTVPIPVAS